MENMTDFLFGLVQGVFNSQFSIWFILGLIFFLSGTFIAFIIIHSRLTGHRINGTIVGGIHRTRIKKKIRDGEEIEKIKHERYLVVDYTRPDGTNHRELSSDGIDKNIPYKTGDTIPLLVCLRKGYDDVYRADSKTPIIMALICLGIGGWLMLPILQAVGMKKTFWLGVAIILIPAAFKLIGFFSERKGKNNTAERPASKTFTDDEIKPLEDILANWNKEQ